jgi:hypothetical protein
MTPSNRNRTKVTELPSRWELQAFGTGQAATILGVEEWRIKNFAEGKAYNLEAQRAVGTNRRRIRVFSLNDVVKLATALELSKFGFTADAIGEAILALEEPTMRDWVRAVEIDADIKPEHIRYLVRSETWGLVGPHELQKRLTRVGADELGMFVLNIPHLVRQVVQRIIKLEEQEQL